MRIRTYQSLRAPPVLIDGHLRIAGNKISTPLMMSALTQIFAFPLFVADLAWQAAGFSRAVFMQAATSPAAQTAAILIAFLAGVSEMLGQSVVLVINRVPLYRFLLSLAYTGATYVVTAITWTLSAFALAPLTRVGLLEMANIAGVAGVVSLAFAPRLLGVFSIAPYFGIALGNVLEVWAMALAIFGLSAGIGLPLPAAAICGGTGWLTAYLARGFLSRALRKPLRKLRIMISGSSLERTPQQIIDDMMDVINRARQA
ncbi:MAG: hypothetical protein AAGB02_03960 [Pseudomonadota bacterium]